MEHQTDSTAAQENDAEPSGFTIAKDDLEELESINSQILMAHQRNSTAALFSLYQRINHILVRTQGIFEE